MNSASPEPIGIILASGSPRRRQLLELIGLRFEISPANVDERPRPNEQAAAFARRTATDKALAVASAAAGRSLPVLGADTVVEIDGTILGKPDGPAQAAAMLRRLSGAEHRVHTGMAIALDGRCEALVDTATVRFLPMSEQAIGWYVATGEPLDKAGAYAIQGVGGLFVAALEGSPHTVVGLPIHRLDELLTCLGTTLWSLLPERR